jgi:hypothetical protein
LKKTLVISVAILAAFALAAQEKKESKKEGKKAMAQVAILHPEMEVKVGSWDQPSATIGVKPTEAWTATTIAAGVNKQPQPGKPLTLVGEIVDFSCYLQLGKHGEAHRPCGQKCVQNGQPVGLLLRDGSLYMLMPEEHDPRRDGGVDGKASASEHMGHIVEVSGTEAMHKGYRALYVQGLTK